jgi:ribosome-binding factor A
MATTRRQQRVNHLLQQEVSKLLEYELNDPRLQGVTVSAVEISPDLKHARIFIVSPSDAEQETEVRHGLQSATPFLRRELGRRIQLRAVPEIHFAFDHSIERADRIERLLREVHDESLPK